jgi:transcriptional regulator with XRE-family HTH domain
MTANGHVDLLKLPIEERTRALRRALGVYQWELAEMIGYEVRQVKRYESGEVVPTEDAAIELARVAPRWMKAKPEWFFIPTDRTERLLALERKVESLEKRLRKAGL